jgi:hypothetical protein
MRGAWTWQEKEKHQIIDRLKTPRMLGILTALKGNESGLSNAEIDSILGTASQWLIFWDLRELMSLGIVEYKVELFGEPGKYHLTQLGLSVLQQIR